MQLISNSKILTKKFIELLENCDSVSGCVAWASANHPVYDSLKIYEKKISEFVVGIHFYQTDPLFIEAFFQNKKVKYYKNETKGVFHPKLFLFKNKARWTIILGSANLTKAALSINQEVVVVFTGDNFEDSILIDAQNIIHNYWKYATLFKKEELNNYKKIRDLNIAKIDDLSSIQRVNDKIEIEIPLFQIPLITMDWKNYVRAIKSKEVSEITEQRIMLLDVTQGSFKNNKSLLNMNLNQRKEIGGIGSNRGLIYGCFGTMNARGSFTNRVNSNDEKLSLALDEIPFEGLINKEYFDKFIVKFKESLPDANEIAGATRLLALKRPDFFVNFNGENKVKLCESLKINHRKVITYDDYWNLIIEKILKSVWWSTPNNFKTEEEKKIYNYRVALLDSIFYSGKYN